MIWGILTLVGALCFAVLLTIYVRLQDKKLEKEKRKKIRIKDEG